MMPDPSRPEPQLRPEQMKTYAIVRKDGVHYRPATCAEVECPQWERGWITRVTRESRLAGYVESKAHGRRYVETTEIGDAERSFMFPPGQACFKASAHRVPIERAPLFLVREGDWRGNPRGIEAVARTADDWTDDFANHQQSIADARNRG